MKTKMTKQELRKYKIEWNKNWRKKNPEKARKYIRNYMRKWRLKLKDNNK